MAHILGLLLSNRPDFEAARTKAATLVMDNFLDEAMGANTGLWPRTKPASKTNCLSSQGREVAEECWDANMENLAKQHRDDESHWSVALWALLKERRATEGMTASKKDEL